MGRLGPSESFAELSVLLNEQITCSVVSATEMTLGIIKPERIQGDGQIPYLPQKYLRSKHC